MTSKMERRERHEAALQRHLAILRNANLAALNLAALKKALWLLAAGCSYADRCCLGGQFYGVSSLFAGCAGGSADGFVIVIVGGFCGGR